MKSTCRFLMQVFDVVGDDQMEDKDEGSNNHKGEGCVGGGDAVMGTECIQAGSLLIAPPTLVGTTLHSPPTVVLVHLAPVVRRKAPVLLGVARGARILVELEDVRLRPHVLRVQHATQHHIQIISAVEISGYVINDVCL